MIRRSLYIMAVLLCSAVEIDAMSLNDALQSENIVLNFKDGGTIWCQYYDGKGFAPHPGYINEQDYIYEGNTYFISMNTLNILNNTSIEGGGEYPFLANIGGSNNICLQEYASNDKVNDEVIRSITFAGDNSQYKGTLYLHPSINKIIFEKEESIISNISIPEVIPNTGSDKESKPFKKPNSPKMIDIYLPDDGHFGTLSISGGILVTFFNKYNHPIYLSFNEIKVPSKTLFVDDRIHIINHHNSNYNKNKYKHNKKKYLLRDININGGEYKTLKTTSYLKFNGNNKYPKRWELHCSTCDIIISNIDNYTSINNLISKANTYNNSICKSCNRLYSSTKEINKLVLDKYYINNQLILTGKCDAKFDYNDEKTHYSYSNLKCDTCNTQISISDDLNAKQPSELFSTLYCNTCKLNFNTQNIELISWLYPIHDLFYAYYLVCSACNYAGSKLSDPFVNYDGITMVSVNNSQLFENPCLNKNCSARWHYDQEYVIGEIKKI